MLICICHDLTFCCSPQAPPGAGKTTTVPLALLLHGPQYLSDGQKIMVRHVLVFMRHVTSLLADVGHRTSCADCDQAASQLSCIAEDLCVLRSCRRFALG